MKALTHSVTVRQQQGFVVYVLKNEEVELAVVPELGAKIISLKNSNTGREWLWHPDGGLNLFRNHPGDDFSQSPLVGVDECLPTIVACSWQDRELPDHGEVWNAPWKVDSEALANGILKTSVRTRTSPFEFERAIELLDNEIRLGYRLFNLSAKHESFLWAIHPLLRLQPGDRLEMPPATRALFNGATWIDAVDSAIPAGRCAKVFASPITEGLAAISNQDTGDRLEFAWDAAENDTLGLWLTRGGWHGHHHFALEATNADADALTAAAKRNRCGVVPPSASVTWQLRIRVDSR